MKISIPKEHYPGEKRVAATPDIVGKLIDLGFLVSIESGAGDAASYDDCAYREAGAEVVSDSKSLWASADVMIKVRAPGNYPDLHFNEVELIKQGCVLICFFWPAQNEELMKRLAQRNITLLAMDSVPRISRAQKLDALSSMANIAGYRAVTEASNQFGRFFSGQITAAGKIPPAKVMVIGAGVAGLAAIGTAKSLGAIVRAFDTRLEVKEQIESLDAEFLELEFAEEGDGGGGYAKTMSPEFIEAEMALFERQAREVDIIITTALIPGRPAPKLITADMVKIMRSGSVIIDLAAEQGGNCELTEPHKVIKKHGVTIVGYTDMPSRLPAQASQLYATNIYHLITELRPDRDSDLVINMDDEVIRGTTVINEGEITWPPPAIEVAARQQGFSGQTAPAVDIEPVADESPSPLLMLAKSFVPILAAGSVLFGAGLVMPPSFMAHLTVFVLACFIGYMVIWNVTPSLHTPLMSVTNAISSIIVVGALIQVSTSDNIITLLAGISILIATINIVGGFAVTHRMLKMFRD